MPHPYKQSIFLSARTWHHRCTPPVSIALVMDPSLPFPASNFIPETAIRKYWMSSLLCHCGKLLQFSLNGSCLRIHFWEYHRSNFCSRKITFYNKLWGRHLIFPLPMRYSWFVHVLLSCSPLTWTHYCIYNLPSMSLNHDTTSPLSLPQQHWSCPRLISVLFLIRDCQWLPLLLYCCCRLYTCFVSFVFILQVQKSAFSFLMED